MGVYNGGVAETRGKEERVRVCVSTWIYVYLCECVCVCVSMYEESKRGNANDLYRYP